MPKTIRHLGRPNQRHRTRKDLLAAAARMLKQGRTPDMDLVATEAMVSRATAYRYFPSIEALLVEAPLDGSVPSPQDVFEHDRSTDPLERVERAERALHDAVYQNESQLRMMLAASLERSIKTGESTSDIPLRQNRRSGLIAAALAPVRDRFTAGTYQRLCASLALVFGTEAMIVFKDVLCLDEKMARTVKRWAIRALVETALRESRRTSPRA
jgi:AcrR family transcriptional regulator